jgi:hypothetical protein
MPEPIDTDAATTFTRAFYGELFRIVRSKLTTPGPAAGPVTFDLAPAVIQARRIIHDHCCAMPGSFGRWLLPLLYEASQQPPLALQLPADVASRVLAIARTLRRMEPDTPNEVRDQIVALLDKPPAVPAQFRRNRFGQFNRTHYLSQIEDMVLLGLKKHLVDPSAIRLFLQAYQAERKRLIATANNIRPDLEKKLGEVNRKLNRLTDVMLESDEPVSQFAERFSELQSEKQALSARLEDFSAPNKTVALHPAAQERYLALVDELGRAIREGGSTDEVVDAVRELIGSVIVEKTLPGEPIRLKVNGRLAALIGQPTFPEGSLSGVKMVAGDRVGQDSRHQTIAVPAIIELGAWRQSMIDAIAKFENA